MAADILRVTLRLKTIDHLFEEPNLSPFDPYYAPYSFAAGIDYVVGEMQRSGRVRRTELTVLLPPDAIDAGLAERTRVAIDRYAAAWAMSAQQQRAIDLWRARQVLVVATLFFAIANYVYIQYYRTGELLGASGVALEVMVEGLGLAAWVALWWPLDQLMHAWWQRRLDEQAYRELRSIDLRLLSDPDPPHVAPSNPSDEIRGQPVSPAVTHLTVAAPAGAAVIDRTRPGRQED